MTATRLLPCGGRCAATSGFRVTPGLLLSGVIFGVVMGLLGGFLPARRAAMPVVRALRE
ncbi:MAG TPA: hypothetical protein VNL18_10380 [Gemmatimonadales bacterium]|nr:hypothetical protein [Gemmatimonadales bacterium]